MFSSIGLIGAGTMGSAVLQAAAKGTPGAALYCSNRTPAKAQALADQLGGQAVDKSIGGLQFRQKTGATIVAVRRGEEVMLSPSPDIILKEQDVLVVICNLSDISQVSQLMRKPAQE